MRWDAGIDEGRGIGEWGRRDGGCEKVWGEVWESVWGECGEVYEGVGIGEERGVEGVGKARVNGGYEEVWKEVWESEWG